MRIFGVSWLCVVVMAITGCSGPIRSSHLPPAQMMMHPGPGVDGPGPGVMVYQPSVPVRRRRRNSGSKAPRAWKSVGT